MDAGSERRGRPGSLQEKRQDEAEEGESPDVADDPAADRPRPAQIRDAAGLPKALDPCHMFRRNLATKLDRHGATTKTIMLAGGWKSPAMVHHYTATEKETVRDAVDILAQTIRNAEAAEQAKKAEGENG